MSCSISILYKQIAVEYTDVCTWMTLLMYPTRVHSMYFVGSGLQGLQHRQ